MKLLDANVLLYAVNESAPRHDEARNWLDGALNAREAVAFSWVVLLAFVRLSTKVGLFPAPLPVAGALDQVRDWLDAPAATVVALGPRHLDLLVDLLAESGTGGNLTTDAHLAALALEHRCVVVTYDRDFSRFAGVRSTAPADDAT